MVTRTGDRDIRSVSGRLPDYPGELALYASGKGGDFITLIMHIVSIVEDQYPHI